VNSHSRAANRGRADASQEKYAPKWVSTVTLLLWLAAGVVAFLPFASDTSAWDAVTLRVPGNQGNWWHFLAGAPFFLAFPMIWLQLRALFANQLSTAVERRAIWIVTGLSTLGTILVEVPFLLHLAGTSEWQRLSVLSMGFGIVISSAIILYVRRRYIPPTRACVAALCTAYLANASLCLVVYSAAAGSWQSRSGWFLEVVIFWPIVFQLLWHFIQAFQVQTSQFDARSA
jgi:hypothetical protein